MKKKLNVVVYCKVYSKELEHLLYAQENILCEFAKDNEMEILDVVKDFSNSEDLSSKQIRNVMDRMYDQKMDALLFYDQTRITPHEHLFAEFDLFALDCEVILISFKKVLDDKNS